MDSREAGVARLGSALLVVIENRTGEIHGMGISDVIHAVGGQTLTTFRIQTELLHDATWFRVYQCRDVLRGKAFCFPGAFCWYRPSHCRDFVGPSLKFRPLGAVRFYYCKRRKNTCASKCNLTRIFLVFPRFQTNSSCARLVSIQNRSAGII